MTGAGLSILASVIIAWLLIFELRSFLTPVKSTDMTVDTGGSDLIRLDFDMSFPKMPCSFANVELSDSMGTVRLPWFRALCPLLVTPAPPPLSNRTPAPSFFPLPSEQDV